MSKPSVLILGADADTQAEISRALKDVATFGNAPLGGSSAKEYLVANPSAIVVSVHGQAGGMASVFSTIGELTAGGARVIVVGPTKDPDLILQAMRAGAREFVVPSNHEELRRAVREQAKRPDESGLRGVVLMLFPTRGGVGATTIATNLAGALRRRGGSVCLVDFDLHLGDVLSFLDLPGTYSITDVLSNMARLDRDLLETSVLRHPSGVRVLGQSGKVEEADQIKVAEVPQLFAFLRRHYDWVVVDGVRGFDEMSLAALDASQKLIMVLTQDVPSVRNTKRCLDLFRRLGYTDTQIQIVLNRFQRDSKITPEVVGEAVGLPVAHTLANDFSSAIESINRGLLLSDVAPRSKLTKDIDQLVPQIAGDQQDGARRAGFFSRIWSKRETNGTQGTP